MKKNISCKQKAGKILSCLEFIIIFGQFIKNALLADDYLENYQPTEWYHFSCLMSSLLRA